MGYRAESFESERLDNDFEYFIGVNGRLPLFGHVLESHSILQDKPSTWLQAKLRHDQARAALNQTKRVNLFEVGRAYFETQKAMTRVLRTGSQQRLAQKQKEFALIKVGLAEASLGQLMGALKKELQSNILAAEAKSQFLFAQAELERAVGE